MQIFIQILLIFICASLFIYLLLSGMVTQRILSSRIQGLVPTLSAEVEVGNGKPKKRNNHKRYFEMAAILFRNIQFSKRTERLLLEAGSKIKPEEFFVLRVLASIGAGAITFISAFQWYFILLMIVVGFLLPDFYMKHKRKKRLNLLSHQLIETLGMMANSMRAGFSFMQAMQLAGKEMPDPLGPEFDRVVHQAGLGVPLEVVFQELGERLPNKELHVVIQAILAQRKSGGNLAELMETMGETVRGRVRILEELKTLTAQGKMSSWVITLIPVFLGVYLNFMDPEYFSPLLNHPIGWVLIILGSFSIVIGWVLIRKIVTIEV